MSATENTTNVVVSATQVTENANTAPSNHTTYGAIEQLATDRLAWQEGAFRTSNEQLYKLLKGCYELYLKMCSTKADAAHLREALVKYIVENKISVKESAHTMTKIVRCVFGNDRRRVSAYSIVLRAAFAAKIEAEKLPDYIRENGGVEEVRLAKSGNYVSPKAKAEVATSWLADANLAVIKSEALADQFDAAKVDSQHVLIVTQKADGSLIANAFVSNQSAVTSALAAYYAANKAGKQAEKSAADTAKSDDVLSDAIDQAAKTIPQKLSATLSSPAMMHKI